MVKDCFTTIGLTLFINNKTKANLCFQRKKYNNLPLKIKFDKFGLIKFMQKAVKRDRKNFANYKQLAYPSKIQYYEDLFAFEYTSNLTIFEQSMDAWTMLLKSFVDVDRSILKDKLESLRNIRPYPETHVNTMENFYQVK